MAGAREDDGTDGQHNRDDDAEDGGGPGPWPTSPGAQAEQDGRADRRRRRVAAGDQPGWSRSTTWPNASTTSS